MIIERDPATYEIIKTKEINSNIEQLFQRVKELEDKQDYDVNSLNAINGEINQLVANQLTTGNLQPLDKGIIESSQLAIEIGRPIYIIIGNQVIIADGSFVYTNNIDVTDEVKYVDGFLVINNTQGQHLYSYSSLATREIYEITDWDIIEPGVLNALRIDFDQISASTSIAAPIGNIETVNSLTTSTRRLLLNNEEVLTNEHLTIDTATIGNEHVGNSFIENGTINSITTYDIEVDNDLTLNKLTYIPKVSTSHLLGFDDLGKVVPVDVGSVSLETSIDNAMLLGTDNNGDVIERSYAVADYNQDDLGLQDSDLPINGDTLATVNSNLSQAVSSVQGNVDSLADDVTASIDDLSVDVDERIGILSEDVNERIETLSEDVNERLSTLEEQVTETIEDTVTPLVEQVNDLDTRVQTLETPELQVTKLCRIPLPRHYDNNNNKWIPISYYTVTRGDNNIICHTDSGVSVNKRYNWYDGSFTNLTAATGTLLQPRKNRIIRVAKNGYDSSEMVIADIIDYNMKPFTIDLTDSLSAGLVNYVHARVSPDNKSIRISVVYSDDTYRHFCYMLDEQILIELTLDLAGSSRNRVISPNDDIDISLDKETNKVRGYIYKYNGDITDSNMIKFEESIVYVEENLYKVTLNTDENAFRYSFIVEDNYNINILRYKDNQMIVHDRTNSSRYYLNELEVSLNEETHEIEILDSYTINDYLRTVGEYDFLYNTMNYRRNFYGDYFMYNNNIETCAYKDKRRISVGPRDFKGISTNISLFGETNQQSNEVQLSYGSALLTIE